MLISPDEIVTGALVNAISVLGRQISKTARGLRKADEVLATARWFETFRLTDSSPDLPDLSPASGEQLAAVLSGAEIQAALQELLAVRLTDAPEIDASQARDAVRMALSSADPDATAFADALARYYDDQICSLVARLEAEEPPVLAQIRSEAFSSRMISILHTIERNTAALADEEPRRGDSGTTAWTLEPTIRRLDPRNPRFVGRVALLDEMRSSLLEGNTTVIQTLHGGGGVGKTQLALEYAHRFSGDYSLIWWINAEHSDLVAAQYSDLAMALKLPTASDQSRAAAAAFSWLQSHGGWLIVLDNAESPDRVRSWIPSGPGHLIITSRSHRWRELAYQIDVDILDRAESIQLLTGHNPDINLADAAHLAENLGDLPLALVQAAGFLEGSGTSAEEYIGLLESHALEVLDAGKPTTYPETLAAALRIACDRMALADPVALKMLTRCALLSPEPIPQRLILFEESSSSVAERGLRARTNSPVAALTSLSRIVEHGLARHVSDGIQVHRLTQAFLRDNVPLSESVRVKADLEKSLLQLSPGPPANPDTWHLWGLLLPHILALEPAESDSSQFRNLACDAAFYLLSRAQTQAAEGLLRVLAGRWEERLGGEDATTLRARHNLALAWRYLGRISDALSLDEETWARSRRAHGIEDPQTLRSANSVGNDLQRIGEIERSRAIHEDTLVRRRRVLGEDDVDTLNSAHNLANSLRDLGEFDGALHLNEEVLRRRTKTLGLNHPHTLHSMDNLATDLLALGRTVEALPLLRSVVVRRTELLGADHPDTLESVSGLARALLLSGETEAARALNDDVLERRARVLGEQHPDTLRSMRNLDLDHPGSGRSV